ncbi:TMEM175 family protein [Mycolicibacterium sp.]|uniref:TMEM175 family protein n=1 Tax=Mycolicibacterium sp. TaxID=2320850 RepID=UPI0028A6D3FA|nr:TMEM175 family protein [Mycolicibacterium sp.]
MEFGRALNLIDAIFGFSLTLLVTTLEVPPPDAWTSLRSVLGTGLGGQLLAFAISFVVVAGMWVVNHQVLSSFRALDSATVRTCIYLVALVIFIPFTTKAVSAPDPEDLPLPTAVFAVNVAAIVLATVALVWVGRARGLTDKPLPVPGLIVHSVAVAAIFLASIPIAYRFGPGTAQKSWLLLLLVGPAVSVFVKRR